MPAKEVSDVKMEGYAFVDAVSKPREASTRRQRLNIVLDMMSESSFETARGSLPKPQDLMIVRIMSTMQRLQSRFSVQSITEGTWFRVAFRHSEGDPPAWVLGAGNDYRGPVLRTNLVALQPLSDMPTGSNDANLLRDLSMLCTVTQVHTPQNAVSSTIQDRPERKYSVRVADVGHANFSAIHLSQRRDSEIVGYFDVGGPVFFHHRSFPKAFNETVPKKGFVALSHWDFDHYSLAVTKLKKLQKLRWYAPKQAIGPNAARLQSLLKNLTLLTQPSFQIEPGLTLWHGNGPQTDRNNSGYVLTVLGQENKILLTGDAAYDQIPAQAKSNVSALCITHHGGAGSGTPPSPAKQNGVAAVSYGVPNRYHHPDETNITKHEEAGWTVKPTFVESAQRGDVWLD